jgi:hypothetical protein
VLFFFIRSIAVTSVVMPGKKMSKSHANVAIQIARSLDGWVQQLAD